MKTAIAAAAFLLLALPGLTHAGVLYPNAITFESSYAVGPAAGFPYLPGEYGTPLVIFGIVSGVSAPFGDLVPAPPYELTFVFENAVCVERGNFDGQCSGGNYAAYQGGTLSFYLDTTPDASFTETGTFRDGEPVLVATQQWPMFAAADDPQEACPMVENDNPDLAGSFVCSGGTWLYRVLSNGKGFMSSFKGEIDRYDVVPAPLAAAGYVARVHGSIDLFGPVATQPTTWGYVKSLYR
jgi:hypothetical protein